MANQLYTAFKQALLDKQVDMDTDDIRVILVDTANYTVNLATHAFLSDVPAASRVAVSGTLTGRTITGGVFDANDVTFTAVTGPSVEALILYQHTGVESTSRLILYIDTATNLPVTPNGGDIVVSWDNGANKIFAL